jgi:hypothetical protein
VVVSSVPAQGGDASPNGSEAPPGAHRVQFYHAEAEVIEAAVAYLADGLEQGGSCVIIATAAHREAIENKLAASGFDLSAARLAGCYVDADAAQTLSRLMVDGKPDRKEFEAVVGSAVEECARNGAPVRVYGEMVGLLAGIGDRRSTLALESLWTALQRRLQFDLFCGYPSAAGGKGWPEMEAEAAAAQQRGRAAAERRRLAASGS